MTAYKELEWGHLGAAHPHADDLNVRKASSEWTEDILIAVDAYSHRHLLIRVENDAAWVADKDSRGVKIDLKELRDLLDQNGATARYVDIECVDAAGHAALDIVAAELASALDAGSSIRKVDLVAGIVAKWRRFWSSANKNLMSKEEQIGLFGELWFLASWLLPTVGPDSIFAWRGPTRSRHDFEVPGASVEVKATLLHAPRHRISSLEQLASPETGPLYLFSVQLREEGGATNCVPTIVATCRQQLRPFPDQLGHFEDTLYQAGYTDAAATDYSKLKVRVVDQGIYLVTGRFPRLCPGSFTEGIPDGVGKISYEIDLSGFSDCLLARRAEAVAEQLRAFSGQSAETE
jgi:Putative  PD-(D/E)XK family member, (DUF4420)